MDILFQIDWLNDNGRVEYGNMTQYYRSIISFKEIG